MTFEHLRVDNVRIQIDGYHDMYGRVIEKFDYGPLTQDEPLLKMILAEWKAQDDRAVKLAGTADPTVVL